MNPRKVERNAVRTLTDLPNIGPSLAGDLRAIGIDVPDDLIGADPWVLYEALCVSSGQYQDPCVLDTFLSVTDFMAGQPPREWWAYTAQRKARYGQALAARREARR